MKSPFIAILSLSLTLWGCAFSKDAGDKAKSKDTSVESVEATVKALAYSGELNEQNVEFSFLEDEPGIYTLKIAWPTGVPSMKMSLNESPYEILNNANSYTFKVLESSITKVHLVALNSLGGESSTLAAELKAPVDMLIKEDRYFHEDTALSANRIYFFNKARLFTHGNNLSISTNKLYIDNEIQPRSTSLHVSEAHIISAIPGRKAPSIAFLAGSKIQIKAAKAYGHLRIAMVGYDGINGSDGAAGEQGAQGAKGSDGIVQYVEDFCVGNDGMPCRRAKTEVVCKTHPTNGLVGGNGSPGGDGTDGTRGGSPGNLSVLVEDSSQFYLEVAQRKGAPGIGGKGGRGGAGGLGGTAGNNQKACNSARNGNSGVAGIDGKNGADGAQALLNHIDTDVKEFRSYEID